MEQKNDSNQDAVDRQQLEQSLVVKGEKIVDDFLALWKKRKLVCTLLALYVLSAPTAAILGFFWGVPALKEECEKLKEERLELKQERDSLKTQLAPWQALAASIYTNAPPDKRLDLLLARVEALSESIQDTVTRLSPPILPNGQVKFGPTASGMATNSLRELLLAGEQFNKMDYTNAFIHFRSAIEFEEASLQGITLNSSGLSPEANHNMYFFGAWSALKTGDIDLANAWAAKAVRAKPKAFDTQKLLIGSFVMLGKTNDAQQAYAKAFKVSTNKNELRVLAGELGLNAENTGLNK